MALMMTIMRYSPEAFRSVAHGQAGDRRKAVDEALARLRAKILATYFSPGDALIYLIIEGDPSIMTEIQFMLQGSGGYTDVTVKLLLTGKEFQEKGKGAGEILDRFGAPNRDEIDRLLLEE